VRTCYSSITPIWRSGASTDSSTFRDHRGLICIGGGTGSFLKFIHRAHPRVELALFELPGTAAYARSRFSPEDGAAITTIEGDMLKDALPGGYDVLLMAHLLHCCNVEENRGLLKRAHSSAPPGAQLLAVDFFLNETKTGPLPCA
jgi:demethylspheroidene O-methyltransferase